MYLEIESSPWKNDEIEKEVEFVQKAAKIIRSARSDYNIPNKTKTDVFVVCSDSIPNSILKKFSADLATTAFCANVTFDSTPPVGCAILTISGQCVVHLFLKGLIESDKELAKLDKKKQALQQTVVKLTQLIAATDYATKVPAEVQQTNLEKLSQSKDEIERITAAMETLKMI